jgi:hypothetical protein
MSRHVDSGIDRHGTILPFRRDEARAITPASLVQPRGVDSRDEYKENDRSKVSKPLAALVLELAVLAITTASFAQCSEGMRGARAQALRDCNAKASKFSEHDWGDVEIYTYRSCMAQHGQRE